MKFKKLFAITFALLIVVPWVVASKTLAATNVSISPASGTVGKNFSININVNTGSDDINGISLDVSYEGNVAFTASVKGDLGCDPIVNDNTDGVVGLTCFINPGDSFTGTGTLATLSFTASAAGEIVFTIDDVDIAGSTSGTVAGATLTVDMDYSGGGGTGTTDDGSGDVDELPETGFFSDNIFLIVGGIFLVVGIIVAAIPETWNWMTLKKKQEVKAKEKFEEKVRSSVD